MNYIGSKLKLRDFVYTGIVSTLEKDGFKDLKDSILCDMFAGTGAIGRLFKNKVKQIIANDKEYYSFVLNQNYIANQNSLSMDIFNELQSDEITPPIEGKIYKNYCLGERQFEDNTDLINSHKRQYFTDYNGAKIDAIRLKINFWKQNNLIDKNTYYHLLASLLESADKVANTASVYGAFLKNFKKSALKKINITPAIYEISNNKNIVYQKNSLELIKNISGDILYLDPPYNSREYGANYHLLNTIALYDDFTPRGKTGLRPYEKSSFCQKSKVAFAFEALVKQARFNYVFLSYNNEGLLCLDEIESLFKKYGKYDLISQPYNRFKADSSRIHKQNHTIEYLHILKKNI